MSDALDNAHLLYRRHQYDPAGDATLDAEVGKGVLGRMGIPEEIAAAVLFVSSDVSAFTTGSVLAVDGGYLAQ